MPVGDYLEGVVFGGLTLSFVVAGAVLFARRRLGQYVGAERIVVVGLVATLGLLAAHLLPAMLGVLGRGTVLAAAALWLAATIALPGVERPPSPAPAPARLEGRAPAICAGISIALLAACALAIGRDLVLLAPTSIDALNFHLPGVARWIETGSIWQIDVFLPDVAPGHYPNNGDVALLAAVLPWRNDFLVHYAMYPFWALTGVAVYALARQLRAAVEPALAAACVVLAIPAVSVAALDGVLVDSMMLFGFTAGLLFCVRHHREGAPADLVLAGLAFGVALGTKWYGLSAVAIVIVVRAVAGVWAGQRMRTALREGAALAGLALLAGGVWLLRNLAESGNPFFPVEVSPLGITIFDAPRDVVREQGGFTLAHYLTDPGVWWDSILPQLRDALAMPALVALGGLVAGIVAVRRRAGELARERGIVVAGIVLSVLLAIAYAVTPYSAGGPEGQPFLVGADARYGVPALIPAAVIAAWAASRGRRGAVVLAVAALLAVVDGVRLAVGGELGQAEPGLGDWAFAVGAVVALALLGLGLAAARRRLAALAPRSRRLALAGGAGVLALVALISIVVGHVVQQRYNERRYVGADAATDPLVASAAPRRVGLAGIWGDDYSPAYPAFGPRLQNRVEYVARDDGDVLRRHRDAEEFAEDVRSGRYDLLVVGRGRPGVERVPELRWARAAGFDEIASSDGLTLFEAPRG